MASDKRIKLILLALFSLLVTAWVVTGTRSKVLGDSLEEPQATPVSAAPNEYVGSDTCAACHEDQFKNFSGTKHAKLKQVSSWKDKVQGCESCHGPGKAHIEDATNPKNIISFKNRTSKQTSETCLACHSGKESHNNFRRGEHWRNDIGCTECHSPHGSPLGHQESSAQNLVGRASKENPGSAEKSMLRMSEPQLCMSCHSETKQQFTKPFHHKVLEGTMKCTDCHNAHGGFENKQTKLAVGADQACVKCHANKSGPFVFEHAPAKLEGCASCHIPHGSSNPKMLKRSTVRQLCLECHTAILESVGSAALPSLHNQSQIRYQQCTVCHSAIHGSNSSNYLSR